MNSLANQLTVTFVQGPWGVDAHTYDEEGYPDPLAAREWVEKHGQNLLYALKCADEHDGRPDIFSR